MPKVLTEICRECRIVRNDLTENQDCPTPRRIDVRVFEFSVGGETDWMLALDQESALKGLIEFHQDEEEPEAQADYSFVKEIPESEWDEHTMTWHEDEGSKEMTYRQAIESMRLAEDFKLPHYLCGSMFA